MSIVPGAPTRVLSASAHWRQRSARVIPDSTSTLAKSPSRLLDGVSPLCAVEAAGAYFVDVDGNEWLDCEMAMGTVPWGHARAEVVQAIARQASEGVSFSTPHISEVQLAEALLTRFPAYEAVRFAKTGAETTTAAVRIARAATRRDVVVTTTYHGAADWAVAGHYRQSGSRTLGIPASVMVDTVHCGSGVIADLHAVLEARGSAVAAIVVCPNTWRRDDVEAIAQAARRCGALLVFDEVTSGMRIGRNATAGRYGVWPDLLCLSKGLTNGLPLGVVLGSHALIDQAVTAQISSAHATDSLAMAAALACEALLASRQEWPSWEVGATALIDALKQRIDNAGLADELAVVGDHASFAVVSRHHTNFWSDPARTALVRALAAYGLFTKGYIVLSDAHGTAEMNLIDTALEQFVSTFSQRLQNGN